MTEWISVEDSLPKHDVIIGWVRLSTDYWAARDGFINPILTPNGYTFWMNEHHIALPVTHWMPLPDPPVISKGE